MAEGNSAVIDSHSHLLPGVDHGCPDIATSLHMAREAAASGVTTVICTPHLWDWDEPTMERVREVHAEMTTQLADAGIELELRLGFETSLDVAASVELEQLRAVTIDGSGGALLLEMPYSGWPVYIEDTIFRLSVAGFLPILAHPERNDRIQENMSLLDGCLRAGAVAQGTAPSLDGEFGRASEQTFLQMLLNGSMSLLASDAHAFRKDGWTMLPMLRSLEGRVPKEDLVALTETNPALLLAGEKPFPVKPDAVGTSWRERMRRQKAR
jgi:protein-tyrosine phosphatase